MPKDEWLTTGQLAELLGVSRYTAYRYLRDRIIPARRLQHGHLRVRRADAESYLRKLDPDRCDDEE